MANDDQQVEVGHGVGVLMLTIDARGNRATAVLTPDEADWLADRLREQAVSARSYVERLTAQGRVAGA